jgi:hypothetical protein
MATLDINGVEGGEEARVIMRVHEQGWNCWRNTLRCVLQN